MKPQVAKIDNSKDLADLASKYPIPAADEMHLLLFNSKNEITAECLLNFGDKSSEIEAMKKSIHGATTRSAFVLGNSATHKMACVFGEKLIKLGIGVLDMLAVFKTAEEGLFFYSSKSGEKHAINLDSIGEDVVYSEDRKVSISEMQHQREQLRKKLIGMNINSDFREILGTLSENLGDHYIETTGVFAYKDDVIVASTELFIGGKDKSVAQLAVVFDYLVNQVGDIDGFAMYHNHPSGDPYNSLEDRIISEHAHMIAKDFGLEMLDHFVVAKDKVYCILGVRDIEFGVNKPNLLFISTRVLRLS